MNAVAKIEQHNPIGTDGFEFVEFTAPDAKGIEQLRQLFNMMGFTETAKHRSKEVFLFQQNDINIVLNGSPTGHVHEFALKHGPSAVDPARNPFGLALDCYEGAPQRISAPEPARPAPSDLNPQAPQGGNTP